MNRSSLPYTRLLIYGVWSILLGCSESMNEPKSITGPQLYWALQLDQQAINLALAAPYDTIRLTAMPLNASGTPLRGIGVVHYTSADSSVTVDSMGLVTAHFTTAKTFVVATLQDQMHRVTHVDTAVVQVTETPLLSSPLTLFSLQPARGDSAKRAIDVESFSWPITIVDAAGDTLCSVAGCSLQMHYASSNPDVAVIDRSTGFVYTRDTGNVVLTASAMVYGKAFTDSVRFRIGYAIQPLIPMEFRSTAGSDTALRFNVPPRFVLGVGAVITFDALPLGSVSSGVVFDDPTAFDTASRSDMGSVLGPPTGSGNIRFPEDGDSQVLQEVSSRRVSRPGVYQYHSSGFPSAVMVLDVR